MSTYNITCTAKLNFSPTLTLFPLFYLSHYFQYKYSAKIEQGVPGSKQIQYRYYPHKGYSFCGKGKCKSLQHCVLKKAVKYTEAT